MSDGIKKKNLMLKKFENQAKSGNEFGAIPEKTGKNEMEFSLLLSLIF